MSRARELSFTTERLGALDPADLLAHLGPAGFAWLPDTGARFVTAGVARRLPAAQVGDALRASPHEAPADAPACAAPIAVGALGFDAGTSLVVPEHVVTLDGDGEAWHTSIGGGAAPTFPPIPRPTRISVTAVQSRIVWARQVNHALERIAAGEITKVVLAREVVVEGDAPFEARELARRLDAEQPGCFTYVDGSFVGASPELLVRVDGGIVESRPMAGTVARGRSVEADDAAVARLVSSEKEMWEHGLVIDAVSAVLGARCDDLQVVGPAPERFATVTHLVTDLRGKVTDGASALDLALALHPTPAVGGTPTDRALAAIDRIEQFDRGRYAGPVGWVAAGGDGEFAMALRCAQLSGSAARVLAGAGIVAGSTPEREWAETEAKLEPVLRVLVRP